MKARLMFIHGLTAIHTGTGQSVDVIDLPIARETTTGWPYLPGSGIKGVLRDVCAPDGDGEIKRFEEVFGPDTKKASDGAGSVFFCDGRILCLPVRSFFGTFAWVTCPSIINRLNRDCASAGMSGVPSLTAELAYEEALVCSSSAVVDNSRIFLEDLDLKVKSEDADSIAKSLAAAVFDDPAWQKQFTGRFVVVSDDLFAFLSQTATEVAARVRIDENQKTVTKGGLWYEEALPAETIFWSVLLAAPRNGSSADDLFGYLSSKPISLVQIGGHASVGRGLASLIIREEVSA